MTPFDSLDEKAYGKHCRKGENACNQHFPLFPNNILYHFKEGKWELAFHQQKLLKGTLAIKFKLNNMRVKVQTDLIYNFDALARHVKKV